MTTVPQPRQLIVTIYGLYAREAGGWLSVASLIDLLADLDVDEPAVRSSISRLKQRGLLVAHKRSGTAGYELSPEALSIIAEGDHRIFERRRATAADGWLLAVFSVPETERHKRHLLRSRLTKLGFGTAAPGVWIAPAHLRETTEETLRRLELDGYADLFHSRYLAFGDPAANVRRWWDLAELQRMYADFLAAHGPVLKRWQRRRTVNQRRAFTDYVRVLTDWRRLPYADPGLPEEYLPRNWIGSRAAALFFSLRERLADDAHRHVLSRKGELS